MVVPLGIVKTPWTFFFSRPHLNNCCLLAYNIASFEAILTITFLCWILRMRKQAFLLLRHTLCQIAIIVQTSKSFNWSKWSYIEDPFIVMTPITKEIEIIHRLFLIIAMYCQASSSQFNEWLYIPHVGSQMQKLLSILGFMFHLSFFSFSGKTNIFWHHDQKKKNISLLKAKNGSHNRNQ